MIYPQAKYLAVETLYIIYYSFYLNLERFVNSIARFKDINKEESIYTKQINEISDKLQILLD